MMAAMILSGAASSQTSADRTTLDHLFRRAAVRFSDRVALVDPPNRAIFNDGTPRRLTYAEADRAIWALAGKLRALGLPTDTVIGIQLPNTVDAIVTILGVLRAGMIPALVPQLWRRRDMTTALAAVGAKAIIAANRIGSERPCATAMDVAAGIFQIRAVASFGAQLQEGIAPLEGIFSESASALPGFERSGNPASHIAVVTFDVTPDGIVPVARSHSELIAGGLAIALEGRLPADGVLISSLALSSFAALSASLVIWLLNGGTLILHQPFDAPCFAQQTLEHPSAAIVVPGCLAGRLAQGDTTVLALWHPDERPADQATPTTVDIVAFGETGLLALPRERATRPRNFPLGAITSPHGAAGATRIVETKRTANGTLALRGSVVPGHALQVAGANGIAALEIADDGFVDTRYPCRVNAGRIAVTGPLPGMVRIGGARFARAEIDRLPIASGTGGVIVAVPDALLGQRLAGSTQHRTMTASKLEADGDHALIAQAFQPRRVA